MEINLKVQEVLNINKVLKSIIDDNDIKINAVLKFRLLGIMRAIETHVTNFEIIKNEKIIEYGEESEDGVYQISKDKPDAIEKFSNNITQELESLVTVNINTLKPDEVFNQGLASDYLLGIYPIIGE